MATTQEILDAARKLGELIASHEATERYRETIENLQDDTEAQRVLTDLNRHISTIAEKEQKHQPVEVEDKQKLEQLQKAVIRHPLLQKFQMAQMDYVDLLRKVDDAMTQQAEPAEAPPGTTPPPGGIISG